jgi:hypothetical protein
LEQEIIENDVQVYFIFGNIFFLEKRNLWKISKI